jgi:hypothetical protein
MSSSDSVTHWLDRLQAGDPTAAEKLWDAYFQRLVALARARLQGVPRRAADEEDGALSAFDSFCRGVHRGRFPQLHDRNNLWRLLVVITARKALDLAQHEARKKAGGAMLDEAALPGLHDSSAVAGLDWLSGREPTPEFAAQVARVRWGQNGRCFGKGRDHMVKSLLGKGGLRCGTTPPAQARKPSAWAMAWSDSRVVRRGGRA